MEFLRHRDRDLRHLVATPFIYLMFIPILILDICIEIYHRVTFPLYGLPYVKRSAYIIFDRQKLSYLEFMWKINCIYCSYANGFLHYASAIAGETERYWCGIQHQKKPGTVPQEHQKDFLPYGDEKAFKEFVAKK